MEKLSYKLKILTIYFIALMTIALLIYNLLSSYSATNVGTISKDNFKAKSIEREAYIEDFFYPYQTTLKAISQSKILESYLSNELPKETIENYFLDIKKSLPCLTQVRFLDNKGMEQIRIEGTPIRMKQDNAISKIVPLENLQDKSNEPYIQKFLSLEKDQISFSTIDLNRDHGKITIPKQPTLRLGVTVYDNLGEKQGIIVFNICLRTFFKLLNKTTLYYVYLIDEKGHFINHYTSKYGLLGSNPEHTIFKEFPENKGNILLNNEYYGESFFIKRLSSFNNEQYLRIVLELKFTHQLDATKNAQNNFILFSLLCALLFLIISVYFSKLPDLLKKKAEQEKLTSKLTNLPNRLALMEDLSQQKFDNSLVILVSINNILKIQNTYGYEISNDLVKEFANYLELYDNGIENVYTNSYTTFGLKYKYQDEDTLKLFLKNFLYSIENYPFIIDIEGNEVEFTIDTTIGVSNPKLINNTLEELNEAENALEYALERKTQVEIFSHHFHENIKENRENLLLAKKIKKAIDADQVILHYQPIYNNHTNKIEKYESLIRMECEGQLVFPDTFLPIAKQINKYNTLSYIVIDKSFRYFKDKDYEFSINISILDIENPEFQEYLFERLNYYKISNKLVLEIVEQEGVENYEEFLEFIKKVKSHGCKIAIDDFGSGYSNYEHIINSSEYIDYLKIDGSLIKNLPTDHKVQILVGSLKFLCDNLDIQTIAEYVEDEEVLKYVDSIGIDYSQGYHIGKPQAHIDKE